MKLTVTGVNTDINNLEKELEKLVKDVANDTYAFAKANTPVRSGNARKNWTEKTSKSNFEVKNNVPYIERLDKGYSRKAPNGITMPTISQIKGKYK